MASRTFEDSTGTLWEVFEVHRASEAPRGVSLGLEQGWLSFVSAGGKRRLAPYPSEWMSVSERELERLCAAARVANPARFARERSAGSVGEAARVGASSPDGAQSAVPRPTGASVEDAGGPVRDVVRAFAHEARAAQLPAIEAMVRLKSLLLDRYGGTDVEPATRADATDMRRVRKWFVSAFYFERRS